MPDGVSAFGMPRPTDRGRRRGGKDGPGPVPRIPQPPLRPHRPSGGGTDHPQTLSGVRDGAAVRGNRGRTGVAPHGPRQALRMPAPPCPGRKGCGRPPPRRPGARTGHGRFPDHPFGNRASDPTAPAREAALGPVPARAVSGRRPGSIARVPSVRRTRPYRKGGAVAPIPRIEDGGRFCRDIVPGASIRAVFRSTRHVLGWTGRRRRILGPHRVPSAPRSPAPQKNVAGIASRA